MTCCVPAKARGAGRPQPTLCKHGGEAEPAVRAEGLLRFARNDGGCFRASPFAMTAHRNDESAQAMCSRTTSLGWSCQRCKAWRKAFSSPSDKV